MSSSCVAVREATNADACAINRIYNYYIHNTIITFDVDAWSIEQRNAWFKELGADNRYYVMVAEVDGKVVGFAYNSVFRARRAYRLSTESTIYTDSENHTDKGTHGIGSALYHALFQRIATTDLHRAYAVIALPNPRSIAFHQKFGFTTIGTFNEVGWKFDTHVDTLWMEKKLK